MTIKLRRKCQLVRQSTGTRRALFAGLVSVSFVPVWLTTEFDDAAAKKHHRRRGKRRKNGGVASPPPPPTPPTPVVRADASCSGAEALFGSISGNTRIAQTFTASTDGLLVSAQLTVDKAPGSSGDYVVSVNQVDGSGFPTNGVLAQTAVANLSVPDQTSTVTFSFASPASVSAGTQYALVFSRPGGDNFAVQSRHGGCAGQAFISPDQTAPFALGDDDGDLIFTAFVSS